MEIDCLPAMATHEDSPQAGPGHSLALKTRCSMQSGPANACCYALCQVYRDVMASYQTLQLSDQMKTRAGPALMWNKCAQGTEHAAQGKRLADAVCTVDSATGVMTEPGVCSPKQRSTVHAMFGLLWPE